MSPPSPPAAPGGRENQTQDFDLHGVVGLRLLNATAGDVATVRRQLGPLEGDLGREPDITVRFVDAHRPDSLTVVGVGESGFDDSSFFLLRGRGGVEGLTAIPFDRVARGLEVVCDRGLPAVPHLVALINLTALAKGVLPVHATAFTSGSTGVLVTGWSKGGKTETLLGCLAEGIEYVGDEWVYLTEDGRMLGLPEPIRLWDWQLEQVPDVLAGRSSRDRRRLGAWRRLAGVAGVASRSPLRRSSLLRRVRPVLERQTYLQIPPADLFGADRVPLEGRLDVVALVMSHEGPETTTRPVDAAEIAARMQSSLEEERAPLMAHYRQFRYAFPDRHSPVIDTAAEVESKLLTALLADRPAVKVLHPHPCDIRLLGRTVMSAATAAAADHAARKGEPS